MRERDAIRDLWKFEEQKNEAIASLDALINDPSEDASELAVVAQAAKLALEASASGLGECREKTPYAPLYPLIDEDGTFKWCCTHEPSHSAS
jgi:hypothetical protein